MVTIYRSALGIFEAIMVLMSSHLM